MVNYIRSHYKRAALFVIALIGVAGLSAGAFLVMKRLASIPREDDHLTSSEEPATFTVTRDEEETDIFSSSMTLTTQVAGQGVVTKDPDLASYVGGATVQLTASPAADWTFDHWECPGDLSVDGATASPVNVVVEHDGKTVTGVFRSVQDLDVAALGGGAVAVGPSSNGNVSHVTGGPETFRYDVDAEVELTPVPDSGREMDYWVVVSTFNTVSIDYDTGPLSVTTAQCRAATALFKPQEGQIDSSTDFLILVAGPGQVIIDYANRPSLVTTHAVADSVPAEEKVVATAAPAEPDAGVFSCWQIVSGGTTSYLASESIEMTDDTTAIAIYHEYAPAGTRFVIPVSTGVFGEGSINIGEGLFMFPMYNVPDDRQSGLRAVHLFAEPAPGWVFKTWHNVPDVLPSTHVTLSLDGSHDVIAEFVSRPGMDALDFVADLSAFLVDINFNDAPADVQNLDFDTGEVKFNVGGVRVTLLPNDIPDAAELALLQGILQDTKFERSHAGGASHTFLWNCYQNNLIQAAERLPTMQPHIHRLTAAYMTIGTSGHRETIPFYLDQVFGVTLKPGHFESVGERFFRPRGDVDNDGKWNVEEWRNTVKANGGVADMKAVAMFVVAAMDRKSDGLNRPDGLGPDEFIYENAFPIYNQAHTPELRTDGKPQKIEKGNFGFNPAGTDPKK
ncbi:MAG: InlB B-repeat-containing protein [Candidatus Hydrogenedentales bacterium]|jgi:hypothetical protein